MFNKFRDIGNRALYFGENKFKGATTNLLFDLGAGVFIYLGDILEPHYATFC